MPDAADRHAPEPDGPATGARSASRPGAGGPGAPEVRAPRRDAPRPRTAGPDRPAPHPDAAGPDTRPPGPDRCVRRVVVDPGGPVLVEGPVEVVRPDGSVARSDRFVVAVCTCRRTGTPPWCDTSHRGRRRPPRTARDVRKDGDGTGRTAEGGPHDGRD